MNRFLTGLLVAVCILMAGSATVLWFWTHPPQGRLTVAAALISRISNLKEIGSPGQTMDQLRAAQSKAIPFISTAPLALARVDDMQFAGPGGPLRVRRYVPVETTGPLPVVLYFHGGGWVLGGLDTHDSICRTLARKSGAMVVAVDYRLAPEHRFPAAIDDAWAALSWVAAQASSLGIDPKRIAVAGDSAGGNLAAALSLRSRDFNGPRIAAQALMYPVTDLTTLERPTQKEFAQGYLLTTQRMRWFIDQYVPDLAQRGNPLVSPLLAPDHHSLPPAIIITAQFDPLRSEGEAYGEVLTRAGVPNTVHRIDGVIHGFASMDRWFPEADQATDRIAQHLRQAFAL